MAEMLDCRNCGEPTHFLNSNLFRKELGFCGPCFEAWKSRALSLSTELLAPRYSKSRVNEAGRALALGEDLRRDYSEDYEVISNWRSAHKVPMEALLSGLKRHARRSYPEAIIAQRLKRIPAMIAKLRRERTMKLSTMQDIGGCRAVLSTPDEMRSFVKRYQRSRVAHELAREDNYIEEPKASGYRGVHLVYRYKKRDGTRGLYAGYSAEVQIRTKLQHAWATAVETVGTFLEQSLKSSVGSHEWLRFFSLVGSGFAYLEGTPPVPGTPVDRRELLREIRGLDATLGVRTRLEAYEETIRIQETIFRPDQKYFVLVFNSKENLLNVTAYEDERYNQAVDFYREIEERNANRTGVEAVLCSVQSLNHLRTAYPNYFHDSRVFRSELERLIG
jgi:ppGpp synthetase/RelA/SpoT-type nucleotidyltranferase